MNLEKEKYEVVFTKENGFQINLSETIIFLDEYGVYIYDRKTNNMEIYDYTPEIKNELFKAFVPSEYFQLNELKRVLS